MARSAIHLREHLAEQLQELGMSAAELGRKIRMPTNRITAIAGSEERRGLSYEAGVGRLAPNLRARDERSDFVTR